MAIDLSRYEDLVAYAANPVDWARERKKVLFLQTAIRLGVPFQEVVDLTRPYFGAAIGPPFEPVVELSEVPPFTPPPFDVARQTPRDWAAEAERAWREYRDVLLKIFTEGRTSMIEQSQLTELPRPRSDSGVGEMSTHAIVDERTAFIWAVLYCFGASWSTIAAADPGRVSVRGTPLDAARAKRRRADQIRKRVVPILTELGLPLRK